MKSFKRLAIDPIVVFGTLCVKCPLNDPDAAADPCVERVAEEIAIVQPRMIVVMGQDALDVLNDLDLPLSDEIDPIEGEVQRLTPTIDALYVPDIDESLDEQGAKQRFWSSFRALGDWYDKLPPY
jgi:uracil-DNA glycosylase